MYKIPNVTLKNKFSMPVLGKGMWMTNIRKKKFINIDVAKKSEQFRQNLEDGLTYIDTAERYANGYIEKLVGTLTKKSVREKLFLVSKVSSNHLKYKDVISSALASIKALGCKYLDLYLIHEFNPEIPLKETMRALDYLLEQKLIKNIGVCDFNVDQIKDAQSYTKNKIVVNQLRYSLINRDNRMKKIVGYCNKADIMIIAWRPYNQKSVTEKTRTLLGELSKKYKKTPSQIALFWLTNQTNTVVLDNFESSDKLKEAYESLNLVMTKTDKERLDLVN